MKHNKYLVAFGTHLRKLREARNMSQQQLAYEADVHQKTIQKIETARLNPSFDTLFSIAEGMNITMKELFDFEY